ncbi:MAG: TlpA family protein disulfide reductase [Dehalococcoidia bacterium]|nr:TlpA family protein disulfide reductase [Dehalococcoidia bacterium]
MRGIVLISTMALLVFSVLSCSSEESPPTEPEQASDSGETLDKAPDFELVLFGNEDHEAGETIKLSDYAGGPVVLNFWFPSCPPCVAEMPDFETAYQEFKEDGVEFIGVQLVGLDSVDDGQKFVDKIGVNYSLGPDKIGDKIGDIVMEYRISGFPTTVLIDRDGNIHRRWSGALDLEKLQELIREIM